VCGRYSIVPGPSMSALLDELEAPASIPEQYNIAPTESVPIIYEQDGQRECHLARWWLTPSWSSGPSTKYAMFNARSETLNTSRAYKGSFRHKRCVMPVTSFIEWQKVDGGKQPIEIYRADKPILFAGLWDCWNEELISCSIVTTKAAKSVEPIHNRMPVLLDLTGAKQWLDTAAELNDLYPLFADKLPYELLARPVQQDINSSRNKSAAIPIDNSQVMVLN